MSNESIHGGHRERLKARFRSEGLDNFTEFQVLELLLFYCIPRQDTNALAHRLIEQFGSLPQVLDTRPEELKKVEGIGEGAAMFLSMIPAVARYYGVERSKLGNKPLTTINDCGAYLQEYFRGKRNETVYLLCLDAKCKPLCCPQIGEGSINSASISIRRVVETALGANATSVVLAHNHPSGVAMPSHEEVMTTRRIAAALNAVDVHLADHIVVADDDYTSLLQSGLFRPAECALNY